MNNSVKPEPVLIIFSTWNPEEISSAPGAKNHRYATGYAFTGRRQEWHIFCKNKKAHVVVV